MPINVAFNTMHGNKQMPFMISSRNLSHSVFSFFPLFFRKNEILSTSLNPSSRLVEQFEKWEGTYFADCNWEKSPLALQAPFTLSHSLHSPPPHVRGVAVAPNEASRVERTNKVRQKRASEQASSAPATHLLTWLLDPQWAFRAEGVCLTLCTVRREKEGRRRRRRHQEAERKVVETNERTRHRELTKGTSWMMRKGPCLT